MNFAYGWTLVRTDPSLLHALQIAVAKPIQDRLRANSKVVDGGSGDYDAV